MDRRRRFLLVLVGLSAVCVTTLAKWCWNALSESPDGPRPCHSAAEAKRRGTWVCDVTVEPRHIPWQGQSVGVREAWVEEAASLEHSLVWFPYYRRDGRRFLCFTLAEGDEVFLTPREPFFVMEDKHDSFAMSSGRKVGVFWEEFGPDEPAEYRVSLIGSWQDTRQKDILFRRVWLFRE
jgi:hypothetical protein